MTIEQYIKSRGLSTKLVAQAMKISRQALNNYGKKFTPTANTLFKIAEAMTALGAETKVVDLVEVLYTNK